MGVSIKNLEYSGVILRLICLVLRGLSELYVRWCILCLMGWGVVGIGCQLGVGVRALDCVIPGVVGFRAHGHPISQLFLGRILSGLGLLGVTFSVTL